MPRKPWELTFSAEPAEVAALRRIMRLHLGIWGLQHITHDAQLCMSELVSNVITHVGDGTPATLAVAMNGTYLRIEVHDPDTRALPTLRDVGSDSETGRGMALVGVIADHWGVQLQPERKVTWCELATEQAPALSVSQSPRLSRAQGLLDLYATDQPLRVAHVASDRLSSACAEAAAVDIVVDILYWLHAHGCDADEFLDRAQTHFEADANLRRSE
ncbi:hypothetical protein GCM10010365_48610 [Streptomyces poonensis]|uniref:Histidine kinase/HSP90-like ATPase domain-containing protein n=1 Tax=Streptomyces poonensis TaxID=68255 RepID=A0A918UND9_9ACTN|nr:hypothetical protein GCM10010365_48610 [Streptomyces poonensis]GLJ91845.1 hypothetical protein GCM10017589_44530 [Streptomyces poonensis]